MVNSALRIVPLWTDWRHWPALRASGAFARGRALPVPARFEPAHFMTCGRGGTGRRAALRSLWPKGRGSSSLLDRTITCDMPGVRTCRGSSATERGSRRRRRWPRPAARPRAGSSPGARPAVSARHLRRVTPRSAPIFAAAAEAGADPQRSSCRRRRARTGRSRRSRCARCATTLPAASTSSRSTPFEAELAALHQRAFDIAAADQRRSRPRRARPGRGTTTCSAFFGVSIGSSRLVASIPTGTGT